MKTFCLRGIGAILLWSATIAPALGQSPDASPAPTPVQPLLPRAPDGTWTITYRYKATPPASKNGTPVPQPDRVATVRVGKKAGVYHVITTSTSGAHTENWCLKDLQIYRQESGHSFFRLTPDHPYYIDFSKTDFDELSWIGMDNFKGAKEGPANSKVFVFEVKNVDRRPTAQEVAANGNTMAPTQTPGLSAGSTGGNKDPGGKNAMAQMRAAQFGDTISRASLDVLSQMPVEYDDGNTDRTYTFSSVVPEDVPMDIIQLLQTMRDQKRRTYVRASPP